MTQGRAGRRRLRRARVAKAVGEAEAEAALDLLELLDLAWHDCYGDSTPPVGVLDDILLLSRGSLSAMARAAHLAVTDWRDVRVAADELRRAAD